jgi:hypothetical protein
MKPSAGLEPATPYHRPNGPFARRTDRTVSEENPCSKPCFERSAWSVALSPNRRLAAFGPHALSRRMASRSGVAPRASPWHGMQHSRRSAARRSCQAIAKAETVSGNAARLGRSVHLCLCKTPGQDRLAALLLLVQGEARSRPATHSPRPLMRASCGVPVVAPDRAVHRAGLTGHATTSGRQEGRSSGTTPARGSRYATIWELDE